ncbi:MAG: PulJ/GspJ family protein [Chthonomonadales bacterium]
MTPCGTVQPFSERHIRRGAFRCARRRGGFTLAEALVAMTMLTIITAATTFALSASLRSREALSRQTELETEGRTALRLLADDLRSAYASTYNPNTFFIAQGTDTGTLVQFTTLAHHITAGPVSTDPLQASAAPPFPQGGIAMVVYSFDPDAGTLSRGETSLPNPDTLPDPSDPSTVVARHVLEVSINYLDANGNLRPYWNFANQQAAAQASAVGVAPGSTATGDEDTTLPLAVQIQIRVGTPDGRTAAFATTVTPLTPQPMAAGQSPQASSSPGGGAGPPAGGSPSTTPPQGGTPPSGSGSGLPGLSGVGARP